MALLYKTIRSIKENKEGKKLYHPRAVHTGIVGTNRLAQEVAEYSSLSTGDVKNTIDNLVTVMTRNLQSSHTVRLDGLGTFSIVLRSQGKGSETPEGVDASKARMGVRFIPASTRNADMTVATRSLITGVQCIPYESLVKNPATGGGGGTEEGGGGTGTGGDEGPMG